MSYCNHAKENIVTDHGSADLVCEECAQVVGKWSPEHPSNAVVLPPAYERGSYFDTVLGNVMGWDCKTFTARDLAHIRRHAPQERDWDVGKVRAITRRLKMRTLTKSAGRMAHALKYGVDVPYPRLCHLEMESMRNMFMYIQHKFEFMRKTRKNLISYAYIVGKLLEEIGRRGDFEHLLVPIKTRSKKRYAEKVWEELAKDAPWRNKVWREDNRPAKEIVSDQDRFTELPLRRPPAQK